MVFFSRHIGIIMAKPLTNSVGHAQGNRRAKTERRQCRPYVYIGIDRRRNKDRRQTPVEVMVSQQQSESRQPFLMKGGAVFADS